MKASNLIPQTPEIDPFFGLKYIAFCRTGLPPASEDQDDEAVIAFAKWQICKVRNVLWNDEIWDRYTPQEILIEFFAIKFDESADLRKEFESGLITASKSDLDWFEKMETQAKAELTAKSKIDVVETAEEFEDSY